MSVILKLNPREQGIFPGYLNTENALKQTKLGRSYNKIDFFLTYNPLLLNVGISSLKGVRLCLGLALDGEVEAACIQPDVIVIKTFFIVANGGVK